MKSTATVDHIATAPPERSGQPACGPTDQGPQACRAWPANGLALSFGDPDPPWQRGTLRTPTNYCISTCPAAWDFGTVTARRLDTLATELNERSRQSLRWMTRSGVFPSLVGDPSGDAWREGRSPRRPASPAVAPSSNAPRRSLPGGVVPRQPSERRCPLSRDTITVDRIRKNLGAGGTP